MRKDGRRSAPGWFFPAASVICTLFSIVAALSLTTGTSPYPDAVNSLLTPVQSAVSRAFSNAEDALRPPDDGSVEEQNIRLRERLMELENELSRADGLAEENARLRRILRIREKDPAMELVRADVCAREPSGFSFHYLINRGTESGVAAGDPVITESGLAGRVIQVGGCWARVAPLSDARYSVGARVVRTGDYGVINGDGDGLACSLSYVEGDTAVAEGDIVETSGLGGIFPKGLRIGRVGKLRSGDALRESVAQITPAVDYERMREVCVVVGFSQ